MTLADEDLDTARPPSLLSRLAVDVTPLRVSPDYRRLLLGQGVSFLGSQMTAVVVLLQVYALTHDSRQVGLVGLVGLVPLVTLGLVGGALADRVDRRRLALLTSSVLATVSVAFVVQAALGSRSVLLLFLLIAVQSAAFAVDSPTRQTFPPRLLPPELLPAAGALGQVSMFVGLMAGPAIGGVLVEVGGYQAAYGVDAATFIAALWALLRLGPMRPLGGEGAARASVRDGLAFLRTRPLLLSTFVADILAMVMGMPRAVFPQLADDRHWGGAGVVGLLNSAIAVGALLAAVTSGPAGRVRRQGVAILVAVGVWGLAIVAFGLSRSLWVAVGALLVGGAADALSGVWRGAVLQVSTPDEYRGRLGGVFTVVVAGGPRLGDWRVGQSVALLGPTVGVSGGGALVVLGVVALYALVPRLREYDAEAAVAVAQVQAHQSGSSSAP